ncbi:phosphotyrosine protein phosphatase [Novosphingobium sp. PC22D]|uniref:low molecular weight protein-tyrosine-phosphatase n=1 Tax=Novosphingobium sp. PC22D TaxID=1962403 RepID=UPI000BF2160D|nr:low molecular weight protein-tyrosine-phosphatase [Novosphingobium sp. PC22D]PEQ13737.1 phosphotyrosine protein phosphatase [Novosphingobium sp. PC22D]
MTSPSLLFVCLGNICRSPLAEAALRQRAAALGLAIEADSAGTGDWHVGEPPDPRAIEQAARHGIDISGYRARQVKRGDFARFSHILALDLDNLRNLQRLAPAGHGTRLSLLLDHVPGREGQPVADPYFGGPEGFVETWRQVSEAAEALCRQLA